MQKPQFGSLTDTIKYCEYLAGEYKIDILTFDYGLPRIKLTDGVSISYIHHFRSKFFNAVLLLSCTLLRLAFHRYYCVWIEYFPYCSVVTRIFKRRRIHIDVRTLSVAGSSEARGAENARIRSDLQSARSVSFISSGIAKQLGIDIGKGKNYILPLGSDVISSSNKNFDRLSLLYVGTLLNRRIFDTVKGVELFLSRYPDVPLSYLIVGNGDQSEFVMISDYISKKALGSKIRMMGYVPYSEIKPFFDSCNVGLSYVPEYECYQDQPPTKTYEYVLSGLFCLATKTRSNKAIITSDNGVLHDDNPESLCAALEQAWIQRNGLDSERIRQTLMEFQWNQIVNKHVIPIVEAV